MYYTHLLINYKIFMIGNYLLLSKSDILYKYILYKRIALIFILALNILYN